jgi:hypothetical protein
VSLALRFLGVHLARALEEPKSTRTRDVLWMLVIEPAKAIFAREPALNDDGPVIVSLAAARSDSEIVPLQALGVEQKEPPRRRAA